MSDSKLQDFIAHARDKGLDHNTIRMMLIANGWKEKDVIHALSEEALDMPVPFPHDTGGAREAFFHLLIFGFLYTTLISSIFLFFTYIHRLFPDVAIEGTRRGDFELESIRRSMAAIIVSFPLLLWMQKNVTKEMLEHPERVVSGIRRWLTYLTLLVASAAVVGTMITLVFYLLEGELSVRFLLKVLVILYLSVGTFAFFFLSLKLEPKTNEARRMRKIFLVLSSVTVVVALVWGAFIIGSPMQERSRKFDERRVEDLKAISSEVYQIVYGGMPHDAGREQIKPLPELLTYVVEGARNRRLNIDDPVTGEMYLYKVLDDTHFKLCAVFDGPRTYDYDVFWDHPANEHCYEFDIDDRQKVYY